MVKKKTYNGTLPGLSKKEVMEKWGEKLNPYSDDIWHYELSRTWWGARTILFLEFENNMVSILWIQKDSAINDHRKIHRPMLLDELLADEHILIGRSGKEIQELFGRVPDQMNEEEDIYILKRYFFGLFQQRLHLFYSKGIVRDYYIGIL
ncbi:hypothetical protein J2X97_001862 [Epilithonimonas hungarica]|uniref:hypothetical protein n=1 Tax=Epilithonimonas hungarica TaxID=454006 RepID=UPI0027825404|nr:hypothetical protein [Epilithonimonas hungarica]MDP9956225.1 hypothetical protein [Epilithonimonas hungarica]